MFLKRQTIRLISILLALGWGGTAQAQFLLTSGSAGENQIGTGLPLPIGTPGVFLGGMTPVNGGTSCGAGPGGCLQSPDGPGTTYWPPLLIPPNPNITTAGTPTRTIMQNLSTTMGGAIVFPPNVLSIPAPGAPVPIAVFTTNPSVFQVATTIDYAWPSATATFSPGGAPGPAVLGTGLAGGVITFSGGAKAFGGSGRFVISAGPGAAGGRVPFGGKNISIMTFPPTANGATTSMTTTFPMTVPPVASVWINAFAGLPTTITMVGIVGAGGSPGGLGQAGATVGDPGYTSMFGTVVLGIGLINQVTANGAPLCCTATPGGSIPSSIAIAAPFPSNMVTLSKGFPFTTGLITISQPGATPPEIFWLSGTDMRVMGVGNVSLVSGALSVRALSGPNANRTWLSLTLPEPSIALGLGGALAMLALCHGLVRRRSH